MAQLGVALFNIQILQWWLLTAEHASVSSIAWIQCIERKSPETIWRGLQNMSDQECVFLTHCIKLRNYLIHFNQVILWLFEAFWTVIASPQFESRAHSTSTNNHEGNVIPLSIEQIIVSEDFISFLIVILSHSLLVFHSKCLNQSNSRSMLLYSVSVIELLLKSLLRFCCILCLRYEVYKEWFCHIVNRSFVCKEKRLLTLWKGPN